MLKHPELVILGTHLRGIRKAKGFSQESFAHAARLNARYYSAIERGEKNVSCRNLIRMAAAFGLEMGQLFPPIKNFFSALEL
jgi:transcriptional regulator with XRE-family HTH domain